MATEQSKIDSPSSHATEPIGAASMSSSLPSAMNYHNFIFDTVKPYLGKRVWEIGSGHGQYTKLLLNRNGDVLATDIDPTFVAEFEKSAQKESRLSSHFIDLYDQSSIQSCGAWNPDSIMCLNVLEHIEDDIQSLRWIADSVQANTKAVFLTPAHQSIYGFMDKDAGHYRRYSRTTLAKSFQMAGWKIEQAFYLNPIGAIGWALRNKILKNDGLHIDSKEVNNDIAFFDNYCVLPTKYLGVFTRKLFGQSVVVIASKPE